MNGAGREGREYFSGGIDGDFYVPDLIAFLGGGDEIFAAVLDPFHGTTEEAGAIGDHNLFGIGGKLWSKAAANVFGSDADISLGNIEHGGYGSLDAVRRLGGGPYAKGGIDGIVGGDDAPGLD